MGRLFRLTAAALALLAALTGCNETVNVGTVAIPTWDDVASFTVAVTVPGNARSGQAGTFTTTITGGTGPFEVTYAFTDCVTPLTTTRNITGRTDTLNVTFDEVDADTECSLTVTVEDANNRTGTRTRTFTLQAVAAGSAPTIDDLAFDAATGTVTVTASDADGDDITINATAPAGFSVDAASKPLGAGGTVDFVFTADDPVSGGTGTASFTATANGQTSDAETIEISSTGLTLEADTLYAVPLDSTVGVGEPARILVLTGVPAGPFQYMNGVRIVTDAASGFEYVSNSFNVGAVGGEADDADGLWADMDPAGGFLLPPDNFIVESDAGSGLTGIDFNVTPVQGSELDASSGALFNFEATFDTAGTYLLGFQETETVDRTFYTDANTAPNRFWGDISNVHDGVANSITVN